MTGDRARNIQRLKHEIFDVLIVGGGINGAGIARDLVLRDAGLNVGLIEQNHFASGTSGRNSQLIHGGLRYLKYGDFALVREALREREILLRISGGLVEPLQFLIPCYSNFDRWFYRLGLALYDLLAGRHSLGHSAALSREHALAREPNLAAENLRAGLLFFDCRVNSARLVLENIIDAAKRGAAVANYVEAALDGRRAEAHDKVTGERFTIRAKKIVDATGAWEHSHSLRLVRGSHLIYPRIVSGAEAISYFDEQGRIIFLIPWGADGNLTLVGTTDVDHDAGPDHVHISDSERSYLDGIVRRLFPSCRGQPVSSYSALRPLIAEAGRSATSTSREHRIWETQDGVLHIAGGKYTTYRAMSEELVDMIVRKPCRTSEAPLDVAHPGRDEQVRMAVEREYARELSDVLFVSTYWGYERPLEPGWLLPIAREMAGLLGENEAWVQRQIASVPASC